MQRRTLLAGAIGALFGGAAARAAPVLPRLRGDGVSDDSATLAALSQGGGA